MRIKKIINACLKPMKIQLVSDWELRLNGQVLYDRRRTNAFNRFAVSKVIDVGANRGQYATQLRASGFRGDIVSFEPLTDAYSELEAKVAKDGRWNCFNLAVGDFDGETMINRASFDQASSLLSFDKSYCDPEKSTVAQEKINVTRLSTIWPKIVEARDVVWLKLDVQGFESQVLDGLGDIPKNVIGMELELSLSPLYAGQVLLPELVSRMASSGFRLCCLEEVLEGGDNTSVLEFNGAFLRIK